MIGTITATLCGFLAVFCVILFVVSINFYKKAEKIKEKGKKYYNFTKNSLPDVKIELGDRPIIQEMEKDVAEDDEIFGEADD